MDDNKVSEFLIEKGLFITTIFFIAIILVIIIFIFKEGYPAISKIGFFNFVFGLKWHPSENEFGVLPMIICSIYVTMLALIMAVPLSLLSVIFMTEIAPDRLRQILKPAIETLSGIPSVVYGFFGLTVLVPFIRETFGGTGFSLFTASLILTVMILPTIISVSQDAIRSVPKEYKEASLSLGATDWQTIKNIIVPAALPGIVTAIILGMGRAIGETLAVMMVAGNVAEIPNSIFEPVRTITSNIALEMGYATNVHYQALFASAIILFLTIIMLLIVANYIQNKYKIDIGSI
ncbi:MAG: phosphate ABC transporter permease subunit PstC [Methanobrevibacter sp.]|jgi:phosphate transport system permease protein|nr:phosphate ABC transporter permease subunit PstC [Candidatus Methanovirga basalitermitum]